MELERPIAVSHLLCHGLFGRLCAATQLSTHKWLQSEPALLTDLLDEFDRYQLWAGNVGAGHQSYKLSLDYRLEEATFYRDRVSAASNPPCRHYIPDLKLILRLFLVPLDNRSWKSIAFFVAMSLGRFVYWARTHQI